MSQARHGLGTFFALCLGLFVLVTSGIGAREALVQRPLFLALVVLLALTHYPLWPDSKWRRAGVAIDVLLGLGVVIGCAWVALRADDIMNSLPTAGMPEILVAAILVIAILELSRRAIGPVFPSLVLIGLLYAFFGQYISGPLGHRGFDLQFITEVLLLSDIGIWGTLLGVAATIIAIFILFGAFLLHSGAGATFMDLAIRVSGRTAGGAAKIATIASGLFGMVSGSAVGNVATTGAFTIPLMKRLGYPAALAGAVEAVASTGGQIAPPIMGAAAFIMAEIIGRNYLVIAAAAVLPALLFYCGVFLTIHITAKQENLGQVPEDEIPAWADILKLGRLAPIVLSLGSLTVGVLTGKSLMTSAFYGILGALAGMVIGTGMNALQARKDRNQKEPVRPVHDLAHKFRTALDEGAKGLIIVGILLAGAQILVAMINLTGIGVTLSSIIAQKSGLNIYIVGLVVAGICMIIGMGIPTTAAYVLVAATLAPALIELGLEPLTSHMFVFYYATLSVLTPPVCIAVFVAAALADEKWMKVALRALRLGAVVYVIPFLFLIYPHALKPGFTMGFIEAALSGLILVISFAYLLGGAKWTNNRLANSIGWLIPAIATTYPSLSLLFGGTALLIILVYIKNKKFLIAKDKFT